MITTSSGALPVALPQVPPRASSPSVPAPPLSASSPASSSSVTIGGIMSGSGPSTEASTPTATLSRRQAFTYAPLPYSPLQAQLSSPPPSAGPGGGGGLKSSALDSAASTSMLPTVARPLDNLEEIGVGTQSRQRTPLGVVGNYQSSWQNRSPQPGPTTAATAATGSSKGKEVVYPTRLAAGSTGGNVVSSPRSLPLVDPFRSSYAPAAGAGLSIQQQDGFGDSPEGFVVSPAPAESSLSRCDADGVQRRHWVIERTSGTLDLSVEDIPFLARSLLLAQALLDRVEAGLTDPSRVLPPHEIARQASNAVSVAQQDTASYSRNHRKLERTIGIVTGPVKDPKFPSSSRRLQIHAVLGPMDAASIWRRKVVYGWLNFYSLEDLVAEMREDTCNNRIRSGYGRAPAPIDRVPFAAVSSPASAAPASIVRQSPPRDLTPRSSTSSAASAAERLWDPRLSSCISFVSDTPLQHRYGSSPSETLATRLERLDKLIGKIELDQSMNELEMERFGVRQQGHAVDVV